MNNNNCSLIISDCFLFVCMLSVVCSDCALITNELKDVLIPQEVCAQTR